MLSNLSYNATTPQPLLPISHYKNLNNIIETNHFDNFIYSFIKNFKPITDDFYGEYISSKKKLSPTKYRIKTKRNKNNKYKDDIKNSDTNKTHSQKLEKIEKELRGRARHYANVLSRNEEQFNNETNSYMNFTGNYTQPEWSTRKKCMMFTALWNIFVVGAVNLIGLVTNSLSIMVLHKDKNNKVPTFLLQTLAVCDIVVLSISFFVLFYCNGIVLWSNYNKLKVSYPYIMKFFNPLGTISQTCVIWSTVLLAINRFIAVCRPFSAKRRLTMFRARMQVLMMVIAVVVVCLPLFWKKNIKKPDLPGKRKFLNGTQNNKYKRCFEANDFLRTILNVNLSKEENAFQQQKQEFEDLMNYEGPSFDQYLEQKFLNMSFNEFDFYNISNCTNYTENEYFVVPSYISQHTLYTIYNNIILNFLTVVLPISLLIALNIPIINAMRNSQRLMQQSSKMYRGTQEKNITTVMTIIILELLICHTPDRILMLYEVMFPYHYSCPHPVFFLHFIFNLLVLLNSSTDFLIYYIFRSRFRNILKNELCFGVKKRLSSKNLQRSTDTNLPLHQNTIAPSNRREIRI